MMSSEQTSSVFIRVGLLADGNGSCSKRNYAVLVSGGRIVAVGMVLTGVVSLQKPLWADFSAVRETDP